jgi:hypothetical protein
MTDPKQKTYHGAVKNTNTGRGISAERTVSANCSSVDIIFPPDLATANKLVAEGIPLLLEDDTTNDSPILLPDDVVVLDGVLVVVNCCSGFGNEKASHKQEVFVEATKVMPIMTIKNN